MINQRDDNLLAAASTASSKIWVQVILLIAAAVYACYFAVRALVNTWSVQDVYSYGFLVPVMSLLWIWQGRERLRKIPLQPSFTAGMPVFLMGSLMLVIGEAGSATIMQELSLVVIIAGLVLMLLGTRYFQAIAMPLSYLVLMVPLLDGVIEHLNEPFQLFAATIAVKLLNVVNIPVFQSGRFIELPNITLEVADACSGVRFLLSMTVLCIPLAFITQKGWQKRVILFLAAITISVLSNPIRVMLVAVWAHYGRGDIHGPAHLFQGYVVYQIGMVVLFAAAWILHKLPLAKRKQHQEAESRRSDEGGDMRKFDQAWAVSILLLLGLGTYPHLFQSEPVHLKANLHELPAVIGSWKDDGTRNDVQPLAIPGADVELARVYRNPSGREIKIQISYFESQRQDKKLTYYKLQMLHVNNDELTIAKDAHRTVRVNKSNLRTETQETLFLSWYDLNGQIVPNRSTAKLKTAFNGVVRKRTNGAVVVVSSAVSPGGLETVLGDEVSFVKDLIPVLRNFLPDANR